MESYSEVATKGVLQEKVSLAIFQNSQENNCARFSFLIKLQASAFNFFIKETLAQVFSCEFSKISKKTFFTELLWVLVTALGCFKMRNAI